MKTRIWTLSSIVGISLWMMMSLFVQLAQAEATYVTLPAYCLGTQDDTYECLDSSNPGGPTYQFQDISGNNPPVIFANNDDGVSHLTMPFSFTFYDVISDRLTVSMNGAMKFGEHINSINAFNVGLTYAPTYFIAPMWDDLDNGPGIGGGIYTDVIGIAPNRQYIVQWENIPHYNNTGSGTFQVIFYEGTNELRFQYEDVVFDTPNFDFGASATVGIKGSSSYVQYGYNYDILTGTHAIHFFARGNDAFPIAGDDGYAVAHDTLLTVAAPGLLGNDTDPNGYGLTAGLQRDPMYESLNLQPDGSLTYQPNANFVGYDFFIYGANDGTSNSNGIMVYIFVVNNAPDTTADAYSTMQSEALSVAAPGVLDNDSDDEGDVITAVLDSDVTHGNLLFNEDGSFSYTPDAGYVGTDSFIYHASDGLEDSAIVRVTLTVENAIPTAATDTYSTPQVTLLTVPAPGVLDNDEDTGGDVITAVLATDVAYGQLNLNSDGSFSYTPNAGFKGTDSFTYTANDGMDDSTPTTVTLVVENVAPVATADEYTAVPNNTFSVTAPGVLSNDNDGGGDVLTAVLDTGVTHGSLTLNNDGSFDYTPAPDFNGEDNFTYHATDGEANTESVTVTIKVKHHLFLPVIVTP